MFLVLHFLLRDAATIVDKGVGMLGSSNWNVMTSDESQSLQLLHTADVRSVLVSIN